MERKGTKKSYLCGMRKILFFVAALLPLLTACGPRVQEFRLGEGYAATSVNAAVFRAASVTSDARYQFAAWYAPDGTVMVARRELAPAGG